MPIQPLTHVAGISGGWLAAWRSRRENPLPRYWRAAEARRVAQLRWWQRNPGLLMTAIVLSGAVTAGIVALIVEVAQLGWNSPSVRTYATVDFNAATGLLLAGAGLLGVLWLFSRIFQAAYFALGFLERQPRSRLHQQLDDLLATSPLSEQEILVGFLSYGLGLLRMPVFVMSVLTGVLAWQNGVLDNAGLMPVDVASGTGGLPWWVNVAYGLLVMLLAFATGMAGAACLLLICANVSLTPRAGLMPWIGAAMHVLLQIMLLVSGFVFSSLIETDGLAGIPACLWRLVSFGYLVPAVLLLLLYIARRWDWVRAAVGYALPLVIAGLFLPIYAYAVLTEDDTVIEIIVPALASGGQVLAVFSPAFIANTMSGSNALSVTISSGATAVNSVSVDMSVLGFMATTGVVLLLMQLLFVLFSAELARDAIKRRKWSAA